MPAEVCTHPWRYAAQPFNMAGNLYYVGNTNVSCHLIDTGDGLILLDTAYPQTVYLLLESIRRLGFDPDNIAYVIHSHAHYDHCAGTKAIVELAGAKTAIGEADVEYMTERPELTWAPEYGYQWYETFDVDVPLRDGDLIVVGNTRVECVHTPGHTPGTMSYFFEVEEGGQVCTAGLFGGPGINTLTDQYMAEHNLPASNRADYLDSIARLKERHVDVHLGAHPNQQGTFRRHAARTPDHNPFVDPGSWPAWLDGLKANAEREWGGGP